MEGQYPWDMENRYSWVTCSDFYDFYPDRRGPPWWQSFPPYNRAFHVSLCAFCGALSESSCGGESSSCVSCELSSFSLSCPFLFLFCLYLIGAVFHYDVHVYERFSCAYGISLIWRLCVHCDDLQTFWLHHLICGLTHAHCAFCFESHFQNLFVDFLGYLLRHISFHVSLKSPKSGPVGLLEARKLNAWLLTWLTYKSVHMSIILQMKLVIWDPHSSHSFDSHI